MRAARSPRRFLLDSVGLGFAAVLYTISLRLDDSHQEVTAGVASSFVFIALVDVLLAIQARLADRARVRFFGRELVRGPTTFVYPDFVLGADAQAALSSYNQQLLFQRPSSPFTALVTHRIDVPRVVAANDIQALLYVSSEFDSTPSRPNIMVTDTEILEDCSRSFISFGFSSNDCTHLYLHESPEALFAVIEDGSGSEYLRLASGNEYRSTADRQYGVILRYTPDREDFPERRWILVAGVRARWEPPGPAGTSLNTGRSWPGRCPPRGTSSRWYRSAPTLIECRGLRRCWPVRRADPAQPAGLFVGLCTLDIIQLSDHIPAPNEKLRALQQTVAAGGPATNAAVTFAHCGGSAHLLTGLGRHPLVAGITSDLTAHGVSVRDLASDRSGPPTVSSIIVTRATGDRAVVSTNASDYVLRDPEDLDLLTASADVVELDGHHMGLAQTIAEAAAERSVLTVLDGGSWKSGSEQLLRHIDVAACSADFRPPGTVTPAEVLEFLLDSGVRMAVITRGAQPTLWRGDGAGGELPVPTVKVADTLGAGDVFHGALTHALATGSLEGAGPRACLEFATTVASRSCGSFGTRAWLNKAAASPPEYSVPDRP